MYIYRNTGQEMEAYIIDRILPVKSDTQNLFWKAMQNLADADSTKIIRKSYAPI